jgi:hypothetical protein
MFFVYLLICVVFFVALVQIGKYSLKKIRSSNFFKTSRIANPREYLPEEELSTIGQICYLVIIVLIVVDILYSVSGWQPNLYIFSAFDILLSLHFVIHAPKDSLKNKIVLFGLLPLGSLAVICTDVYLIGLDSIHLMALAYYIKVYYDKFVEYTETNSLGITIMLLFLIVFVSFFITMVVEGVSPLDSLNMVSNAFTSNGYTVLGKTGLGKADAIFLVWSGFLLSCVGTATLSVSIIIKHIDKKFDDLEEHARRNKKK